VQGLPVALVPRLVLLLAVWSALAFAFFCFLKSLSWPFFVVGLSGEPLRPEE
jgi:hypothetical protein